MCVLRVKTDSKTPKTPPIMYGLLLESLACYIKEKYGDEKWEEIRRASAVEQTSFSTHQVYPENLIPRLSNKAIEVCISILFL